MDRRDLEFIEFTNLVIVVGLLVSFVLIVFGSY